MKRVTIKDLGKMLHLSVSTISRALNDHPDISDETRLRVKETARAFNYRPNLQARFFRKKHSGLLALIMPEINMFYAPSLIEGINKTIGDSNYSLVMFQSDNSVLKEKQIIEQCISWAVEGVMISVAADSNPSNVEHLSELNYADIKCLQFDRIVTDTDYSSITIDNLESARIATAHLIKNGHRNIIGLFGHKDLSITIQRELGFRSAFEKAGIPIVNQKIIKFDQPQTVNEVLPKLIKSKKYTALFAMTDEALYYATNTLRRLKISIPEELSVIAISDGIFTKQFFPQITHIEDSGKKMGKAIVEKLIKMINSKEIHSHQVLNTQLVELGSVKKL